MADNRPVCNFYLKGQCKYGDRCKFRHPVEMKQASFVGGRSSNVNSNIQRSSGSNSNQQSLSVFAKHSAFSSSSSTSNTAQPTTTKAGGGNASLGNLAFNADTIKVELSWANMWPISCYGPDYSTYPPCNLIAGVDVSPDEVRMQYYHATRSSNSSNALQQYMVHVSSMVQSIQKKRQQILSNVTMAFEDYTRQLIAPTKSVFSSQSAFAQSGNPVQSTSGGQSVFASLSSQQSQQQQQSFQQQSVFSQSASFQQPQGGTSVFAQGSQPQQSIFANTGPLQQSLTQQPSQPPLLTSSQNPFAQPLQAAQQQSLTSSPFAQSVSQNVSNQQVGISQSVTIQSSDLNSQQVVDPAVWTRPFEFGKIPECEPPANVR
ncbi:hypothetical protein MP228_001707 [Amoeboaphelidium protococcarum]|nr:hypothetical protein MP228_001707 [Amoeboaphelidium protococcarum]